MQRIFIERIEEPKRTPTILERIAGVTEHHVAKVTVHQPGAFPIEFTCTRHDLETLQSLLSGILSGTKPDRFAPCGLSWREAEGLKRILTKALCTDPKDSLVLNRAADCFVFRADLCSIGGISLTDGSIVRSHINLIVNVNPPSATLYLKMKRDELQGRGEGIDCITEACNEVLRRVGPGYAYGTIATKIKQAYAEFLDEFAYQGEPGVG